MGDWIDCELDLENDARSDLGNGELQVLLLTPKGPKDILRPYTEIINEQNQLTMIVVKR